MTTEKKTTENEKPILPTNDVMFKIIFGDPRHPRILIHFLNSVIKPKSPITHVEIRQTELSKDFVQQRGVRLDIVATTQDKEIISVEMQKEEDKHIVGRAIFYWSKLFAGQLSVSEEYEKLHRTVSINILDFTSFKEDERFLRKCILVDEETKEKVTDLLEFHFIELKKMKKYTENDLIGAWIEFFNDPYSPQVQKMCQFIPEIKEAKEVFEQAKYDPAAQELMRMREKGLRDYFSSVAQAERKGVEKGLKKGREEGREEKAREMALNFIKMGIPLEQIAEGSCLSIFEVQELAKTI